MATPGSEFDPYYKWLSIPPELQPPDHYCLLGLKLFEDDREVIATAADRQMAHVKTFAVGRYSRESQSLLAELAKAKLCLLNAQKKSFYDARLLAQTTSSEQVATMDAASAKTKAVPIVKQPELRQPSPQILPTDQKRSLDIKVDAEFSSIKYRSSKRPASNLVHGWYLLTFTLAVVGVGILWLSRDRPQQSQKPSLAISVQHGSESNSRPCYLDIKIDPPAISDTHISIRVSGTATHGLDYLLPGQNLIDDSFNITIPTNQSSKRIEIRALDDEVVETREEIKFKIRISQPNTTNTREPEQESEAIVFIGDSDTATVGVYASENARCFNARISKPSDSKTTIRYSLTRKISREEYVDIGEVTIPKGQLDSKKISIRNADAASINIMSVNGLPSISLAPFNSIATLGNFNQNFQQKVHQLEQPQVPDKPIPAFIHTPTTCQLPPVSDTKTVELCKIPQGAVPTEIFSLGQIAKNGLRIEWQVPNEPTISLGEFVVGDGKISFCWEKNVPLAAETALRNSMMKLAKGDESHLIALRTPLLVERLIFDSRMGRSYLTIKSDHLPALDNLCFEVLEAEDLPPSSLAKKSKVELSRSTELRIQFDGVHEVIALVTIDNAVAGLRLRLNSTYYLPSGRVRMLSYNQISKSQNLIDDERSFLETEIEAQRMMQKKAKNSSLSNKIKELEGELKLILSVQNELDRVRNLADKLDGKAFGYRFYTIVDGHEVDLIISK